MLPDTPHQTRSASARSGSRGSENKGTGGVSSPSSPSSSSSFSPSSSSFSAVTFQCSYTSRFEVLGAALGCAEGWLTTRESRAAGSRSLGSVESLNF
ncbi:Kalirin [Manis pentadactyla]|nr:Kalirin [Manis pentadactyla]